LPSVDRIQKLLAHLDR